MYDSLSQHELHHTVCMTDSLSQHELHHTVCMTDSLSQYKLHHAVCMVVSASISNGSQLTMTIRQPRTTRQHQSVYRAVYRTPAAPLYSTTQLDSKTQLSTTATLQQRLRNITDLTAPIRRRKGKDRKKNEKQTAPPPPPHTHTHACN